MGNVQGLNLCASASVFDWMVSLGLVNKPPLRSIHALRLEVCMCVCVCVSERTALR